MSAIEVLMDEHRLIERMVKLTEAEASKITETGKVNVDFIVMAVDFFRTYADKYHHGKEEGILFKELSQKKLLGNDQKQMRELVLEHAYARRTVNSLENMKVKYLNGEKDALNQILQMLKALIALYPRHIEKEDKQFFPSSTKYFTEEEHKTMMESFTEFDETFTNKKYLQIIQTKESKT